MRNAVTKKRRFPSVYVFLSLEKEYIFRIIKTNVFVRKVFTSIMDHKKNGFSMKMHVKYKNIWSKTIRNFRMFFFFGDFFQEF